MAATAGAAGAAADGRGMREDVVEDEVVDARSDELDLERRANFNIFNTWSTLASSKNVYPAVAAGVKIQILR